MKKLVGLLSAVLLSCAPLEPQGQPRFTAPTNQEIMRFADQAEGAATLFYNVPWQVGMDLAPDTDLGFPVALASLPSLKKNPQLFGNLAGIIAWTLEEASYQSAIGEASFAGLEKKTVRETGDGDKGAMDAIERCYKARVALEPASRQAFRLYVRYLNASLAKGSK